MIVKIWNLLLSLNRRFHNKLISISHNGNMPSKWVKFKRSRHLSYLIWYKKNNIEVITILDKIILTKNTDSKFEKGSLEKFLW